MRVCIFGFLPGIGVQEKRKKSSLFLDITPAPGKRNMKIDGRMAALFGHGVVPEVDLFRSLVLSILLGFLVEVFKIPLSVF